MFINLSNHSFAKWNEAQIEAAKQYGEIIDMPFPQVDPKGDVDYIAGLADEYRQKVFELANGNPVIVHLMGEMTFTHALVHRLKAVGVECLASTTERVVLEETPDKKTTLFRFVRFRK